VGWQQDNNYLMGSIAHFNVNGRSTEQQTALTHSHSQASCEQAVVNMVCFAGDSQLAVLAGKWAFPHYKTVFNGEAWLKQEQGDLFSQTAKVDYQGIISGGWLMADYQIVRQLHSFLRYESLQGRHQLTGANAALVATEAGIAQSSERPYRVGVGMMWTDDKGVRISLETHHEKINQQSNQLLLLRYQVDLWTLFKSYQ